MTVLDGLGRLMREHGIQPRGVVHVGAHLGEEVPIYRRLGFRHIILVEPNPAMADQIDESQVGVQVIRAACGAYEGRATLHVTAATKLSSLYRPISREIASEVEVPVIRLADVQDGCNVAVVDVQGAELDVVAGADLSTLELITLEARLKAKYAGAPSVSDVVGYMARSGWVEAARWPHLAPGKQRARLFDVAFVPEGR